MSETETALPQTDITIVDISATEAWQSLGSNLKQLLALALQLRNLPSAIREIYPALDAETRQQIAEKLLLEPAVQSVVNMYALRLNAAKTPQPVVTPDENLVAPPADVPVIDAIVFSDAAKAN